MAFDILSRLLEYILADREILTAVVLLRRHLEYDRRVLGGCRGRWSSYIVAPTDSRKGTIFKVWMAECVLRLLPSPGDHKREAWRAVIGPVGTAWQTQERQQNNCPSFYLDVFTA